MDFQDLLDEVEQVIGSSTTKTTTASRSSHPPVESPLTRRKSVDIDDLLSMIDDGDDSPTSAIVHPQSTTTPSVSTKHVDEFTITSGSKKCSTLMLGGEMAKRGVNTAFASHNVCSNLRCNECDFTVVQFLGMKWSSNADYMFFRENVPNEAKLRARMEAAPSSAAYACQCKWLSIDVQTRADMCRVKWSCAGH